MIRTIMTLFCLSTALLAAGASASKSPVERCQDFTKGELNLYWGDLHVHTSLSLDAFAFGTTSADPRDAFAFARGQELTLGDKVTRIKLQRPLDFAAVTDHAETFDVMYLCTDPNYLDLPYCNDIRARSGTDSENALYVFRTFLLPIISGDKPKAAALCSEPGIDCNAASRSQWRRIQHYANEADSACEFTAFIANEWSATPNDRHWHRNLIFAGSDVSEDAIDYVRFPSPKKMWQALDKQCRPEKGCDVIAIPHNTNLSEGGGFDVESSSEAELQLRARYERLIEIHQSKGNSECLNENRDDNDADCGFEILLPGRISQQQKDSPDFMNTLNRSYARNILSRGLQSYSNSGATRINPLQMGFIGSTDTHVATPGAVSESNWKGDAWGGGDTFKQRRFQRMDYNPGGLVAVWSEQNTRANLFAALKRREVYGTSGTRIRLRFLADPGSDADLCSANYDSDQAISMGGSFSNSGSQTPTFAVTASQDAVPLSEIQLIKGTLNNGEIVETVYSLHRDAVGTPHTCRSWTDPDHDPAQPAYWYARVLEIPTPRWSKTLCEDLSNCQQMPAADQMIQERAWSSPIWYLP